MASDTATLEFDPQKLLVGDDCDIRDGLSAVALDGAHLWLACDEGCRLERLSQTGSGLKFSAHQTFPLGGLLDVPGSADEEADIEGLDIDEGWLWLVGSHSVKRKKPKADDSPKKAAARLAETSRDGNRHLLARIPLGKDIPRRTAGSRRSAWIETSKKSSALLDSILKHDDPHLAPFVPLPGKDNGLDIEGIAVRGMRAFVGLRGPVLREWCCILELHFEADGHELRLEPLDGSLRYRKHFLKLSGLGVRDLLFRGDDLLILSGPSMAHDGPHEIWCWKNGAKENARADATRLLVLPQREGVDRAEGFTDVESGGAAARVIVVFDTPARTRKEGKSTVLADVYKLP